VTDPRSTYAYQRARRAAIANAERLDFPCGICGGRIRYDLPGTHPDGPSADHVDPVALHGGAGVLRVTHQRCNASRGSRLAIALGRGAVGARARPDPGPSRQW